MGREGVKDGSERSPASVHLHGHRHTCSPLGACTTLQLGKAALRDEHTHTLAKPHFQNPQGRGLYTTALHPTQYRVQALQNFPLIAHQPSLPSSVPKSPDSCKGPKGQLFALLQPLDRDLPGSSLAPQPRQGRGLLEAATLHWGPTLNPGRGGAGGPFCLGPGPAGVAHARSPGKPGPAGARFELPRAWGRAVRAGPRALRPCCPAGGSAASATPPTAAAAPRAPPSRCPAPAPSARPGAPTGSWRAGTGCSCR